MELQNTLHMVGGEGETSYAINSTLQKTMFTMEKPYIERSISDLLSENIPKCLRIADLGCSSGPNSLLPTSEIIDAIHAFHHKLDISPSLEIQVFLNDLPGNDFNSVFNAIPSFYEKLKTAKGDTLAPRFIAGVPGSFYGRLFPSQTLSFVHSSTCLHWLSQVPQGVEDTNKGNISIAMSSPASVCRAFLDQFQNDFYTFLRSRSEELLPGGRVVISMFGRRSLESCSWDYDYWGLLASSLNDMVTKGTVDKGKFDAFNLPFYSANGVELKEAIEKEGSFRIDVFETLDIDCDSHDAEDFILDKRTRARNEAKMIRAVTESLIVSHFGEQIVNELFDRFADYVGEYLEENENKATYHILCLAKKG